ncbi:MAG: hypothetical protein FJW39_27050 [Acidobacteria bacterium]|nr:hypothetical protein [Acidobacteriota bacterium]
MYTRFLPLLVLTSALAAQHITGSIRGSVADPSAAPVAGVQVELINTATNARAQAVTDDRGGFEFLSLVPGTYDISIEASGFKRLRKTGLVLLANQAVAAGTMTLELGTLNETVSVSGKMDVVQTASSERSATVNRYFLDNLQSMSRDPLELIALLPGFTTEGGGYGPIHAPHSMREFAVNGGRRNNKNWTVDGIAAMNTTTGQAASVSLNIDAVEQVQVQLANYQAEFGRTAGAGINFITRSGTRDFHGTGYFYLRNEVLNANEFFRNRFGQPRTLYRYRTQGFTIGGPVTIPKLFNRSRDKLFFFFSESQQPASLPPPLHQLSMPSAAERGGDFSQTVDQQGRLLTIRDATANAPFPGNRIPASRINPFGKQLLDFFPQPNISDPSRRFNYQQTGIPYETPRREEVVKVDYNVTSRFTMYGRYAQDSNDIVTDYVSNYSAAGNRLSRPGRNFAFHATQILSPRLVNDVTFGHNRLRNDTIPENESELAKLQRAKTGITLGQFSKDSNPLGLVPNLNFGPLLSGDVAPRISQVYNGLGMKSWSFVDNLSKIQGAHTLKFGVYWERTTTVDLPQTLYAGSLDFAEDPVDPNRSGHPYANAMLGNFARYQEVSLRRENLFRFNNLEWYLQDSWRASKKLTFDLGLRFYWHQPEFEQGGFMTTFDPGRFNASRAPRLYAPFRHPQQGIVAVDPANNATVPRTLTGAIVPGSGDIANGLATAGKDGTPKGLQRDRGLYYAPRVGFAFDPTGKGGTAIRGGFGLFYDRLAGAVIQPLANNPPSVITPTIYYGNLGSFLNASGVLFPQTINVISGKGELPVTMNFSLGIQKRVSSVGVVDIAYVGSLSRHLAENRDYSTTPFGTNFLRANEDPTAPGRPLRQTFLRPFTGYDAVNVVEMSSNSSYHSLQTQFQRRFGRRFNIDGSWTWSKALGYADGDRSTRSALLPKWRDYGRLGLDTTHIVNLFYVYEAPALSSLARGNKLVKALFDNWRISGISRFSSGVPFSVAYQAPGVDFTGSTEAGRINVNGRADLPKGERTFSRFFNTSVFSMPRPGVFGVTTGATADYGNAPRDIFRGPGINNFNLSFTKSVPVFESHRFSLGCELFNAFNHTQFRRLNNVARYNAAGQQTNPQFGEYQSTNGARVIQLWLRYSF